MIVFTAMMGILLGMIPSLSHAQKIAKDSISEKYILPGTGIQTNTNLTPTFTGSVSGEEISIASPNINNMLFGRIPGLIVSQANGEPGYDAASFRIRGLATYNNSTIPVYIDGFETNLSYLQYISPSEIESIEVLKDACALAPFGMRGANGILWITTKRGKIGKTEIKAQVRGGIQKPININKPLGTQAYKSLYNEAYSNDNGNVWNSVYTPEQVNQLPDVDWYDEVLKNQTTYTDADISVSGGDQTTRYYILFGYMDQNGLYDVSTNDTLANSGISRYNIRTNLDINLFSFLEAKVDLGGRIENRRYPNRSAENLWNEMAKYPSSVYPVKNGDGTWTGSPIYNNNPLASINGLGRISTHDRTLQFNFQLKEKLDFILDGLYVLEATSLSSWTRDGASNTRNYARYLDGTKQTTDEDTPYYRSEDSGQNQWSWQHFTGTVGYDKTTGEHIFSASTNALYNIYKTDFSQNGNAGKMVNYQRMNISGGANYIYQNKYTATFAYSISGSDNYRAGRRWGFYPSIASTWLVSEEDFLKNSKTVNALKIRTSIGRNGWDPMREKRFLYQEYYNSQGGLNTGNGTPDWHSGLALMYIPNKNIFAESSMKYDFGADVKMFDKLDLTIDLFLEKRSGIVTQDYSIPFTAGITNPMYGNIGKVSNKGFEVQLKWSDQIGDFSYFVNAMASYNSNKIDYMAEIITLTESARTGKSIGSLFGYIDEGFYNVSDFDTDGNLMSDIAKPTFGAIQAGDIKYKDITNDGIIDENDQSWIGNSYMPKMVYALSAGINYKGFDFFVLFEGINGREVNLLDFPIQNIAFRDNGNVYESANNRWAYYPDQGIDTRSEASYPRLSLEHNNNNYQNSTVWKRNGDYLKMRNLEFAYTISGKSFAGSGISSVRLKLSGINLLTFGELMDEYNIDPEVLSGHPAMKSYNVGISITF